MVDFLENKLGNVYVRRGKYGAEDNTDDDHVLLEGARFSNFQLKVIPGTPNQNDYKGHKFSFGVLGHKLAAFFPLGSNLVKDKEELTTLLGREIEMAKKLHLITGEEGSAEFERKFDIIRKAFGCLYISWCVPGRDYLQEDLCLLIGIYGHIDDIMESFKDADKKSARVPKNRHKCSYKITCRIGKLISDALLSEQNLDPFQAWLQDPMQLLSNVGGDHIGFEKWTEEQMQDLRGMLNLVLTFASNIRKAAIEAGLRKGCSPTPLLQHMSRMINALSFEYSKDWHNTIMSQENMALMLPTMNFQRQTTLAMIFVMEVVLLLRGISVPEIVRQSSVYRLIYYHLAVHCKKCNDMFSFKKEMQGDGNEWRNNEACILHKTGQMSESEAMSKMAQDANHAKDQMELLFQVLVNTWRGGKEQTQVENFVVAVEQCVEAYIRWNSMVDVYHKNLIFDCYIDD